MYYGKWLALIRVTSLPTDQNVSNSIVSLSCFFSLMENYSIVCTGWVFMYIKVFYDLCPVLSSAEVLLSDGHLPIVSVFLFVVHSFTPLQDIGP